MLEWQRRIGSGFTKLFLNKSKISQNVQGLNDVANRSSVKSLIGKWKVDIICLKKIKIVDWS